MLKARAIGVMFLFFTSSSILAAENEYVTLRGYLSTSFDDNVTFSSANQKKDVVQSVLLGLDFNLQTSRNQFLAQCDLSRNLYFDNSSFDNTAYKMRLIDVFEISPRLRLSASNAYLRREEPSSFDDQFGRTSGRYRRDNNQFDMQFDYQVKSQMILQWMYTHQYTGYSRQDLEDTDKHQVGARVEYQFNESNRLGAGYEYSRRFFEKANEFTGHSVFVDYGHSLSAQLNFSVRAGEDFIANSTIVSTRQARYDVSLINDIDKTTRGGLKYRRGLSTYSYSQDLFDSYQFSLELSRELTSRLRINTAGFFGQGEYKKSRIRDCLSGVSVSAEYSFTEQISSGFEYSYSQTNSNQNIRSYERNLVSLQMKLRF